VKKINSNPVEVRLLKLLVFVAIFTPVSKVSRQCGQFILNNNAFSTEIVELTSPMRMLVSRQGRSPYDFYCIRTTPFAYILAKILFGGIIENRGYKTICDYIMSDLFEILRGSNVKPTDKLLPVMHLKEIVLGAFCEFKIWHGVDRPNASFLRYSFLNEMIIKRHDYSKSKLVMKELLRVLKNSISAEEYAKVASQTSRIITDQAFILSYPKRRKISPQQAEEYLLDAWDVLSDCDDIYESCDRRGHIYKTRMRISHFAFCKPNLAIAPANDPDALENIGINDGISREPSVSKLIMNGTLIENIDSCDAEDADDATVESTLEPLDFEWDFSPEGIRSRITSLIETGHQANKHFHQAMDFSHLGVPHPMIGLAQTWDSLLSIVEEKIDWGCLAPEEIYRRIQNASSNEVRYKSVNITKSLIDHIAPYTYSGSST
jgi:hypothetical protein